MRKKAYKKNILSIFILLALYIVSTLVNQETASNEKVSFLEWDQSTAPNYYQVIGQAEFTYEMKTSPTYGPLDQYQRPTWASLIITKDLILQEQKEERQNINVDPIGWPTCNPILTIHHPRGNYYKGYLFNRSHMIADSFGGDPIYQNLITGTRSQNVGDRTNSGGMAYGEIKIREYFKNHDSKVYYQVENLYANSLEKIPRASMVDIKSEDGQINERILVYNVANEINFSYIDASVEE